MPTETDSAKSVSGKVHSLVQLLRTRSDQEIRERMYDAPPGTAWWIACKTELDTRNSERIATAFVDTSRVLDKIRVSADRLDATTNRWLEVSSEMADLLKRTRESGRRIELAVYVVIGVSVLQLFYVTFQIFQKK